MMEHKKIKVKGSVYEKNKTYVTPGGQVVILKGYSQGSFNVIDDLKTMALKKERILLASEYTSGKIEKPEIKPINGKWYLCCTGLGNTQVVLFYNCNMFVDTYLNALDGIAINKIICEMVRS